MYDRCLCDLRAIDVDPKVPFIFGCPFLAIGRAFINAATVKLSIRGHDKVKVFDEPKSMKLAIIYEELSDIKVINLESKILFIISKDPLKIPWL